MSEWKVTASHRSRAAVIYVRPATPRRSGRPRSRRSRQQADTATDIRSALASGFVLVTHPFHPLAGQRVEVLARTRRGAMAYLRCAGGPLGAVTIPAGWTDQAERPAGTRLTYEALAGLAAAVAAIRDTPAQGR